MGEAQLQGMSETGDKDGTSSLMAMRLAQARSEEKLAQVLAAVGDLRVELKELKSTFATKERVDVLENRVKKMEEWNTWLLRIILGGFVAALCGLVYVKGGM